MVVLASGICFSGAMATNLVFVLEVCFGIEM